MFRDPHLNLQFTRVISSSTTLTEMTMCYDSNPAATTAVQLGSLMTVIGAGAMHAAAAARETMLERREASVIQAYAEELHKAQSYAYQVNAIAEVAIARVHELEAEVADLRTACRQRQGALDRLMALA